MHNLYHSVQALYDKTRNQWVYDDNIQTHVSSTLSEMLGPDTSSPGDFFWGWKLQPPRGTYWLIERVANFGSTISMYLNGLTRFERIYRINGGSDGFTEFAMLPNLEVSSSDTLYFVDASGNQPPEEYEVLHLWYKVRHIVPSPEEHLRRIAAQAAPLGPIGDSQTPAAVSEPNTPDTMPNIPAE